MKRRWILLLSVALVALCLGIFGAWRNHLREQALALRIADVKALLNVYGEVAESNAIPQMRDLLMILERKNIFLHNPIPKDRYSHSYRIVHRAGTDNSTTPDAVLVEETDNVDDAKLRVRGFADGSIRVERK